MVQSAKEYILENTSILTMAGNLEKTRLAMIEFAKLHVEEALKCAGEKAVEIQTSDTRKYVSKKAIKNSYSLENVK